MKLSKPQQKIVDLDKKNLLVLASAGSGKTFVVIERVLNKVINDKIDIDRFLIITFTKAAASELKERIYIKLLEKLELAEENNDEQLAKYISKQISKLPQANISTIHSFCLQIISSSFYVLGIDPNVITIPAPRAKMLLLESIEEVIENEYEESSDVFLNMLDFCQGEKKLKENLEIIYKECKSVSNLEEFQNKTIDMYDIDENIGDLSKCQIGNDMIACIKDIACDMLNILEKLIAKIPNNEQEYAKRLDVITTLKNIYDNVSKATTYDGIYELLQINTSAIRLPSNSISDEDLKEEIASVKGIAIDKIKELKRFVSKTSQENIKELNSMKNIVEYIFELVKKIDKVFWSKKEKLNGIDFSDYEHLSYTALQDEAICKAFKDKYYEVYVDEYQDTSYMQEAIISKIVKDNNYVMVGDIKQSIYSFRGAVPAIITHKGEVFKDDENINVKVLLDTNYRSRKQVIESVNLVFSKIMNLKLGGARYNQEESLKYGLGYEETSPTESMYKTCINIVEYDKETNEESNEETENEGEDDSNNNLEQIQEVEIMSKLQAESYMIANRIKELCQNLKLWDKSINAYRNCEYKDIVILLRNQQNRSNVVVEQFEKQNIPVVDTATNKFFETQEVMLILSFFKIIDNIYDDVSMASVMYSVIGGFTIDEMVRIRIGKRGFLINSINEYIEENNSSTDELKIVSKLKRLVEIMNRYREYVKTYSISECLIKLYNDTYIYESIALSDDAMQKKANLDSFLKIAKDFEKEENKSIYSFITYIESIKQIKDGEGSPKVLGDNENVVRIMTIHHSKGLEFPVVIMANTAEKIKHAVDGKIIANKVRGIGVDIMQEIYGLKVTYPSAITNYFKQEMSRELYSEAIRLLYVAMTRAKEHLEIFGTVSNYEQYISKLSRNINEEKISSSIVMNCSSNLKLILQAMMSTINSSDVFELNVLTATKIDTTLNNTLEKQNLSIDETVMSLKEKFNLHADELLQKEIVNKHYKPYTYTDSLDLQQRYSVTNIKRKANSMENIDPHQLESLTLKTINPSSATDFGTAVHKVMEYIAKGSIKEDEISQFVTKLGFENKSRKICDMINTMLKSNVKELLENNVEVQSEYEFILLDDLENIIEPKYTEPIMIQGIIDLLLKKKDGEYIIIDYKTDKVSTKDELVQKYKVQLMIYKRAVEKILNGKCEAYIYSFGLNELIKI